MKHLKLRNYKIGISGSRQNFGIFENTAKISLTIIKRPKILLFRKIYLLSKIKSVMQHFIFGFFSTEPRLFQHLNNNT